MVEDTRQLRPGTARRERELKHLARRAQKLGYTLTAVQATAPESHPEPGGEGRF